MYTATLTYSASDSHPDAPCHPTSAATLAMATKQISHQLTAICSRLGSAPVSVTLTGNATSTITATLSRASHASGNT